MSQLSPSTALRPSVEPRTRVIGLTGGIASGKSTVSRLWRALGATIIDADQVARDVVAAGSEGLAAVLAHFGSHLALPTGGLDRKALGQIVFADPAQLHQLELLLHPRIRGQIDDQISRAQAAGAPAVVIDAALLVEMGLHQRCDVVVVVHCGPERQLARLMARDHLDEVGARQRLAAQTDDATRLAAADLAIDNRGSLQELEAAAKAAWDQATAREGCDDTDQTEHAGS